MDTISETSYQSGCGVQNAEELSRLLQTVDLEKDVGTTSESVGTQVCSFGAQVCSVETEGDPMEERHKWNLQRLAEAQNAKRVEQASQSALAETCPHSNVSNVTPMQMELPVRSPPLPAYHAHPWSFIFPVPIVSSYAGHPGHAALAQHNQARPVQARPGLDLLGDAPHRSRGRSRHSSHYSKSIPVVKKAEKLRKKELPFATPQIHKQREEKRSMAVSDVKTDPMYYERQNSIPTSLQRPLTPDPHDKSKSKRDWEAAVGPWRQDWREIDGVCWLLERGCNSEDRAKNAWSQAGKLIKEEEQDARRKKDKNKNKKMAETEMAASPEESKLKREQKQLKQKRLALTFLPEVMRVRI